MSDQIRSEVEKFLIENNVNFSAHYVCETVRNDNWKCDQWNVTLSKGKTESVTETYYTGLGHRKANKQGLFALRTGKYRKGTIAYEQWENQYVRPVKPHAADVLYSLIGDSNACESSFNEWCENYGLDNDSITAFNTYQQCCSIGEKITKFFGHENMSKLREMLQDY